ncbi:MAG: hypothetical protein JSR19_06215 [Proteobacteria bacterium]|nr:hypothetical protein [Pseudomonadota bacterium]HQR04765.1 hypothetical protein [Rhodocyclaceae bacterium]
MNRAQRIALSLVVVNLVLVLLFQPFDYVSLQRGNVPTFSGFRWVFSPAPNMLPNHDFLTLEIIVVLINASIAWLLLRDGVQLRRGLGHYQRGVLWLVAVNLVLMLLFPPFERYSAVSRAVLPSFEGFYFIFADNSQRQLVTTILYLEITLVLANGAMLWLFFKERKRERLTPEQMQALAAKLRQAQRR